MLVCLEFEAKSLLGYANLDVIFDKAMALPNANEKVYETIAGKKLSLPVFVLSLFTKNLRFNDRFYELMMNIWYNGEFFI